MRSIEDKLSMIESPLTKIYFKEVYSSYVNGNYRSAIVSLWSVLVCDATYKLNKLVDILDDGWAKNEISKIENLQKKNSKSSSWEIDVFEGFYKEKRFIGIAEINNIKNIQENRHLCAHPIMSEGGMLHTPSREMVVSMIHSALDDFLTRNNYYTKNSTKIIVDTLSEDSEFYGNIKNIKPYINKMSRRMTDDVIYNVFKSLWKLSFKDESIDACKHRRIIHHACMSILDEIKNKKNIMDLVKSDILFFEQVTFKTSCLTYLFSFLSRNKFFFFFFSDEFKGRVKEYIYIHDEEDIYLSFKFASSFAFDNVSDYLNYIKSSISDHSINRLTIAEVNYIKEIYSDMDINKELNDIIILFLEEASTYDQGDDRMDLVLEESVINSLTLPQLNNIVRIFDSNSQVRGRRRASLDISKIKNKISEI